MKDWRITQIAWNSTRFFIDDVNVFGETIAVSSVASLNEEGNLWKTDKDIVRNRVEHMKYLREHIKLIIKSGEGYNLEFKESPSDRIAKDICAFSNANGGTILLGVTDDCVIKGITITNKLKSQIQDIGRNMDPPVILDVEGFENILVVEVTEGTRKPYSTSGRFYLRIGANSQQLKREEIRRFFQEEGMILFDEKINTRFDIENDFNTRSFGTFLERAGISPVIGKQHILENLFLLEGRHLKNAGVLLFCQRIGKFHPQATITCILYRGDTKYKILDRKEFDTDMLSNFNSATIYLHSKLNTEYIIKGGPREEKLELPENALREGLLNAIAHRDYFVTGANILVEIFSDRVMITNPGGLVKGLRKEDLGKKSLSRNNLLFGLMQRMDLVEKAGTGILRMNMAMEKYGLKKPEIETDDNWFSIVFKRPNLQRESMESRRGKTRKETSEETSEETSNKTSNIIINLMRANPEITAKQISHEIGITSRAVEMQLSKLKETGKVKRVGSTKSGCWEVVE
ncbi:MAG: ATP-binding protein [Thermoplasmata archaeon]|nr:ATP-binding protein [Thermoplasmata archaeon]